VIPGRLADKMPDGATQGESISPDVFDALLDEYYDLRGWDRDGIPTLATLERLELQEMAGVVEDATRDSSSVSR